MSASAELYAIATRAAGDARVLEHIREQVSRALGATPEEAALVASQAACARWCARCRHEARASLYGRAGDAARALEERA